MIQFYLCQSIILIFKEKYSTKYTILFISIRDKQIPYINDDNNDDDINDRNNNIHKDDDSKNI